MEEIKVFDFGLPCLTTTTTMPTWCKGTRLGWVENIGVFNGAFEVVLLPRVMFKPCSIICVDHGYLGLTNLNFSQLYCQRRILRKT